MHSSECPMEAYQLVVAWVASLSTTPRHITLSLQLYSVMCDCWGVCISECVSLGSWEKFWVCVFWCVCAYVCALCVHVPITACFMCACANIFHVLCVHVPIFACFMCACANMQAYLVCQFLVSLSWYLKCFVFFFDRHMYSGARASRGTHVPFQKWKTDSHNLLVHGLQRRDQCTFMCW